MIRDTVRGEIRQTLDLENPKSVAPRFSLDGRLLLCVGSENVLFEQTAAGVFVARKERLPQDIKEVAFCAGQRQIVTAISEYRNVSVSVWDLPRLRPVKRVNISHDDVMDWALSPDGRILATVNRFGTIWLTNTSTGVDCQNFARHDGSVVSLAFSPHGRLVISASVEPTIHQWDSITGKELKPCSVEGQWDYWFLTSPSGGQIITRGRDRQELCFWDLRKREISRRWPMNGLTFGLTYSPDGKKLAISHEKGIQLWDVKSAKPQATIATNGATFEELAFSPDGSQLVGKDGETELRLWHLNRGKKEVTSEVMCTWEELEGCFFEVYRHKRLAFTPDGQSVLCGVNRNSQLEIFHLARKQRFILPENADFRASSFVLSPDGRNLAVGSPDGKLRLYEMATLQVRHEWDGHRGAITPMAFSPDGRRLASGSVDGTVLIWDLDELAEVARSSLARR